VISEKSDEVLANLEKIEIGLSKVYEQFSKKKQFSNPVKKFWITIMNEEITHSKIFEEIRDKAKSEESFEIENTVEIDELKGFVDKVIDLLNKIKRTDISESEAYTYGATIEGDLKEVNFINSLKVNDKNISKKVEFLKNSYNKHKVMMINHAKGIK